MAHKSSSNLRWHPKYVALEGDAHKFIIQQNMIYLWQNEEEGGMNLLANRSI
jgi:hypothetical protein